MGGTRFIGPHVVRRLTEGGHEVALFNRGQSPGIRSLPEDVVMFTGDRTRLGAYRDQFRSFAPDVVVDLFPYTEADARLLMDTFADIAARVVAVSSCDVYRAFGRLNGIEDCPIETGPLTEDSPLCETRYPLRGVREDLAEYDKVLVERAVMGHKKLAATVLRLPMVYGPGDYQHRLYPYLQQMQDGRRVILMEEGLAAWHWSRGYVEDIAEAICLVVQDDCSAGQIYHVGEEDCLTMAQWVEQIAKNVGWSGEVVTVPAAELPSHLAPGFETRQHIRLDTGKIRRELGYRERFTRNEAMSRTIQWELAHPPEKIAEWVNYAAEDEFLARTQNGKGQ